MLELFNEEHVVALRPARDESDHYDVKCPACKHSAYLHRAEGEEGVVMLASEIQAGDEISFFCPQPIEDCGYVGEFTVREHAAEEAV